MRDEGVEAVGKVGELLLRLRCSPSSANACRSLLCLPLLPLALALRLSLALALPLGLPFALGLARVVFVRCCCCWRLKHILNRAKHFVPSVDLGL